MKAYTYISIYQNSNVMKIFKLAAVLCSFVLFACQPKYYIPNSHQVTMFTDQGDVNLGFSLDGNQYEIQAAYALTDQFSAAANFSRFSPNDDDDGDGGSGWLFEAAPGFYKTFGDDLVFETYALLGFGSVENYFPSQMDSINLEPTIEATAIRFGLQPSISKLYDRFSIGLSTRVSSLNYANIKGNLTFLGVDQIQYLEDNKSNLLIEPAVTARFGTEKVRAEAQYGFSFNASNTEFLQNRQYLSIGINVNMNLGDIDL